MLKWTLKKYLDENDVSAYRLAQTTDVSPTTVYALARGEHERISLEVLDKVLGSLSKLTGRQVTPNDILERHPDPEPMDAETRAWLDADLGGLGRYEPYDWGTEGEPAEGDNVRFIPGEGWIVETA